MQPSYIMPISHPEHHEDPTPYLAMSKYVTEPSTNEYYLSPDIQICISDGFHCLILKRNQSFIDICMNIVRNAKHCQTLFFVSTQLRVWVHLLLFHRELRSRLVVFVYAFLRGLQSGLLGAGYRQSSKLNQNKRN